MEVVEYFRTTNPDLYQFVQDMGGDLTFENERLWMDMQEAAEGLTPVYDAKGRRVYHRWLLKWMDSRDHHSQQ